MNPFEELVSLEVRRYHHLYNPTLKSHKNQQMFYNSWQEISETLGTPAETCRKTWGNLRDRFTKAKARMKKGGKKNVVPPLYLLLQWLDPHIKHRPTTRNMPSNESGREEEEQPSTSGGHTGQNLPYPMSPTPTLGEELEVSNVAAGGQLTCSTLSLMVPTLRLMSAFAWQVVQHSNVLHYGKVEELVQLVTEVVPHLLSDTEKVHLLLGLKATEEFPETDLLALVWEFISRLDKLLPLPDIKQTAELLSAAPSLLEECVQLEFEPDQLKTLLHHTQQRNAKEFSWVQSQGTIPPTASSPQSKPQQNCSNIQRCRRSGRKLSPHRTEEDKDRPSDHSLEEKEGAEGKQSDEEWLPEDCRKVILQSDEEWLNDHIIEEEEGAEGKQSDEASLPGNCSETSRSGPSTQAEPDPAAALKESKSIASFKIGSKRRNARRFEDTLCELVKNYVHLYDVTSPLHRKKRFCQNSWDEIASTLKLSAEQCKNKWIAIRKRFVRAHNKDPEKQSGGDLSIIQRVKWLKSYVSHQSTLTNDPNNDDMEQHLSPSVSSLPVLAGHSQHHEAHITAMKRPIHRCSLCSTEFTRRSFLKVHMGTHTRPFCCDQCDKRYPYKHHLRIHQRVHTGERPFTCTHCGLGFRASNTLLNHVRTHTDERRYACDICGKAFIQQHAHSRHMRMHKGEKNYLCTECGKAFLTSGELGKHTRWHTGERPYLCKMCGKRFAFKGELTVHERIHTGEKPYGCTHCPKAFGSRCRLKRHEYIHSDKKPFACIYCGKGFTQNTNLKTHIRTCKNAKDKLYYASTTTSTTTTTTFQ